MLIWFYRLLFIPVFLVMFPIHLPKLIRRGHFSQKWRDRLGDYQVVMPSRPGFQRIWLQVVSVGEAQAAMSLIQALSQRDDTQIFVTTTTSTAYQLLSQRLSKTPNCWLGYFPFDFAPFTRRAWRRIRPDLVVLMESELWPEHLYQASCFRVPVWLINARHSQKTQLWFSRFPRVAQWLYAFVERALFVSNLQQQFIEGIGVPASKLSVMGQLKFDANIPSLDRSQIDRLRLGMGFLTSSSKTLYVIGSSLWPGEEEIVLNAAVTLRDQGVDVRVLIIPRHAERGQAICETVGRYGLTFSQRSCSAAMTKDCVVHVADTTGEAHQLIQCADLALVGKSFEPHCGGQTPLELAACGVPMVYGPLMTNFVEVCSDLESLGLAVCCSDTAAAESKLVEMLSSPSVLTDKSRSLRDWVTSSQGALRVLMKQFDQVSRSGFSYG